MIHCLWIRDDILFALICYNLTNAVKQFRSRATGRTDHYPGAGWEGVVWQRSKRQIKLSLKAIGFIRIQAPLLHMSNHTNNLPGLIVPRVDSLTDRIIRPKVFMSERFVDHCDGHRSFVILNSKKPSLP